MPADRQLRLEPLLDRRQAQLAEPRDPRLRERLVRKVGERGTAPEAERAAEQIDGRLRPSALERERRLLRPAFEAVEVETVGRDAEDVARRARLDRVGAKQLAE